MNILFAWAPGGMEVVLILVVVLVLFGSKKIPEFAKGLGQGIREFKKASREVSDEIQNASADTPPQANSQAKQAAPNPQQPPAAPAPAAAQSSTPPKA